MLWYRDDWLNFCSGDISLRCVFECLMFGSQDSPEPVRHVSMFLNSLCWAQAASHITGPLCPAAAAVLAQLSAAVVKPPARQLSGGSGSSPLRHNSADLEPGSESERRDLQDDAIPEPHLDLHDNECGQEGRVVGCRAPGGRAARLLRQQTSQLSAFHQTLAAWPAIPGPGLAGEWFHDVCTKLFCDTATALTSHWLLAWARCLTLKAKYRVHCCQERISRLLTQMNVYQLSLQWLDTISKELKHEAQNVNLTFNIKV